MDYTRSAGTFCPICNSKIFTVVMTRFDSRKIVKCSDCGHMYLNPMFTDEELIDIYRRYYTYNTEENYLKDMYVWLNDPKCPYQHALNYVEQESCFSQKRVLEVGCGIGLFLNECRNRGAYVTAIDRSIQAAKLAKKHFNLNVINKTVEQVTENHDFRDASFDIIFAFEIIEHVNKPIEFLETLHQWLMPNGLLFISTPNFHLLDLMKNATPCARTWSEHINFFDHIILEKCLTKCKFKISHITALYPLSYGEIKKQILAHNPFISKLWKMARHIGPFYFVKDIIFNMLNKYNKNSDASSWNGETLFCIAKKSID